MIYCDTPESAIDTSISQDAITHWRGNYHELARIAQERGYEIDYVEFQDQRGDDEFVRVVDIWGWTAETPEGEQDWRVYVEE